MAAKTMTLFGSRELLIYHLCEQRDATGTTLQLCTPVCNLYTGACYTERVVNPGNRE